MILLRHGQSHFNVVYGATRQDPGIVDPGLTAEGIRQVEAAAELLVEHDIRRIVASPYSRTLETAQIVAERLELSVTIEPLVREQAYFTCDIGTPSSELSTLWPHLDFSRLVDRWWSEPEESEDQLQARCAAFHTEVARLDDWPHLLIVSHWAFIRGLTGVALQNAETIRFAPSESPPEG